MTSPSYSVEKTVRQGVRRQLTKRVVLLLLACCIQMIYVPTSNRAEGGIEPMLPIDVFPIWPVWVLPYVLCYVLWFSSAAWILLRVEDREFRSFVAACILAFSTGALTFIFFPTYVRPATLTGTDVFTHLLRIIHENWGRYDAFPSGHVYITTLLVLFFSRWYPRTRFVWQLILVIVSLSTLFTGQHYILDVIGGYVVALAGFHFGLWWTGSSRLQGDADKRTRKRIPSSSLN